MEYIYSSILLLCHDNHLRLVLASLLEFSKLSVLQHEAVSLMLQPQPGGPHFDIWLCSHREVGKCLRSTPNPHVLECSLCGPSVQTCPSWMTLPVATPQFHVTLPNYKLSLFIHLS